MDAVTREPMISNAAGSEECRLVFVTRPFLSNLEIAATNSGILFLPKENIAVKKACRWCWAYRMYNEISLLPKIKTRRERKRHTHTRHCQSCCTCSYSYIVYLIPHFEYIGIRKSRETTNPSCSMIWFDTLHRSHDDLHVLFLQISELHRWIYIIKRLWKPYQQQL